MTLIIQPWLPHIFLASTVMTKYRLRPSARPACWIYANAASMHSNAIRIVIHSWTFSLHLLGTADRAGVKWSTVRSLGRRCWERGLRCTSDISSWHWPADKQQKKIITASRGAHWLCRCYTKILSVLDRRSQSEKKVKDNVKKQIWQSTSSANLTEPKLPSETI